MTLTCLSNPRSGRVGSVIPSSVHGSSIHRYSSGTGSKAQARSQYAREAVWIAWATGNLQALLAKSIGSVSAG